MWNIFLFWMQLITINRLTALKIYKNSNTVKYFFLFEYIKKIVIYSCDECDYSRIQCHVIFQKSF